MTKQLTDEIWTQRDGTPIAVGAMSESHVRSALRMLLRNRRKKQVARLNTTVIPEMTIGEMQDHLDAQARDHRGMAFNQEHRYWYHI